MKNRIIYYQRLNNIYFLVTAGPEIIFHEGYRTLKNLGNGLCEQLTSVLIALVLKIYTNMKIKL